MTAIRPLLALYFPRLLESTHPPRRDIKEITDSNELSDQTPTPISKASRQGSSPQQSSSYFSAHGTSDEKDVEKGTDEDEKAQEGKTTRQLEFTDFSKYVA